MDIREVVVTPKPDVAPSPSPIPDIECAPTVWVPAIHLIAVLIGIGLLSVGMHALASCVHMAYTWGSGAGKGTCSGYAQGM